MKKGFFLAVLFSTSALAQNYEVHVLEEGETLSGLLHSKGYSPLYGEKNWVQKTLEINHLASTQAKELKKGFPVILPSKDPPSQKSLETKNIYKEKIVYKTPRRKGILAGLISEHQKVSLEFAHRQNQTALPSTTLNQRENFSLGMRIEGNNRHRLGNLIYDINGEINVQSQGAGQFENSNQRNSSLAPRYQLSSDMRIDATKIPFNFGPQIIWEQRSRIFEANETTYESQRNALVYLGFKLQKDFSFKGSKLYASASYNQNFFQLDNKASLDTSILNADIFLQVTDNYFAGLGVSAIEYEEDSIQNEQSFGVNFRYIVD